jgi:hypothetical protein
MSLRRIRKLPIPSGGAGIDQRRTIPSADEAALRSAIAAGRRTCEGIGSPFFPHPGTKRIPIQSPASAHRKK